MKANLFVIKIKASTITGVPGMAVGCKPGHHARFFAQGRPLIPLGLPGADPVKARHARKKWIAYDAFVAVPNKGAEGRQSGGMSESEGPNCRHAAWIDPTEYRIGQLVIGDCENPSRRCAGDIS